MRLLFQPRLLLLMLLLLLLHRGCQCLDLSHRIRESSRELLGRHLRGRGAARAPSDEQAWGYGAARTPPSELTAGVRRAQRGAAEPLRSEALAGGPCTAEACSATMIVFYLSLGPCSEKAAVNPNAQAIA